MESHPYSQIQNRINGLVLKEMGKYKLLVLS